MKEFNLLELHFVEGVEKIVARIPSELNPVAEDFWCNSMIDMLNHLRASAIIVSRLNKSNHESD